MSGVGSGDTYGEELSRLMADHFSTENLTDEELIAAVRQARDTKKRAEAAAVRALSARGWSWRRIGAELGVHPSTAHTWAYPDGAALPPDDDDEPA